jgi:alpha-1,2-mannosyltransferase
MVSTDMLRAVASRAPSFNNAERVARSPLLSAAKLAYYRALAAAYGAAGRCAHVAMVNSSWTSDHIRCTRIALQGLPVLAAHAPPPLRDSELWDVEPELVFPPCDTAALRALPLARPASPRLVVSVAQFRPEKAHAMQLRAWAAMRARAGALGAADAATLTAARLVLVGGVRGAEDAARLDSLRKLAAQLRLGDSVSFLVGVPAAQLRQTLAAAHVGLHTMRDEHFGISVVEYMAAGAVPLAHDSAGPRMDIVAARAPGQPRPGRLADSEAGFAAALEELLLMPEQQRLQLAAAAREATGRFSEDAFAEGIIAALRRVLPRGSGAARAQQPAWAKAD